MPHISARTAPTSTIARAGAITEIVGRLGSGRTSLFTACVGQITRAGGLVALVDSDDTFDPEAARRAGMALGRLLWVRCGGRRDLALRATDVVVRCPGFAAIGLDVGETPPRLSLAATFRLRLAVRRSAVALIILGRERIAGASAALAVQTVQTGQDWRGAAARPLRLAGVRTGLQVVRKQNSHSATPWAVEIWWRP